MPDDTMREIERESELHSRAGQEPESTNSVFRPQGQAAAKLQANLSIVERERSFLEADLLRARRIFARLKRSVVYRCMTGLGLWSWLKEGLERLETSDAIATPPSTQKKQLRHIVVDMTPLRPGGDIGGAKVVAVGLVRELRQTAPGIHFTLLTNRCSHDELAALEAANVERFCVDEPSLSRGPAAQPERPKMLQRVGGLLQEARHAGSASSLLDRLDGDLLFCPLSTTEYFNPRVPMVSLVYDLQHTEYPQFFSSVDRRHRDLIFRDTCRCASAIVCMSDYVRRSVLENSNLPARRVRTIRHVLFDRFGNGDSRAAEAVLETLKVQPERYLLYPANFWPHKNHAMLLTAFGMFLARNPDSDLKLVCTGAPGEGLDYFRQAAQDMNLAEAVCFPGYLNDDDFRLLLKSSKALIYPSLYEGFGLPVLEAMAAGKPVLSANSSCLPEVTGGIARLFDARNPWEIVRAIESVERDSAGDLVERGLQRISAERRGKSTGEQYLSLFHEILNGSLFAKVGTRGEADQCRESGGDGGRRRLPRW